MTTRLLLDDDEGRKITTRYSKKITPQQFEKLKFWCCSFIQRSGSANDAMKPIKLYETLLEHCERDTEEATFIWCRMLATVGLKIEPHKQFSTPSDIVTSERFLWGEKMVELSDKLYTTTEQQQSIMHHFHTKFAVEKRLDDLKSPIALFQQMIWEKKLTVGEAKGLEAVEETIGDFSDTLVENHTNTSKSHSKTCRRRKVTAVGVFILLLIIVVLCAMTKFPFFKDLHGNRTIYYNGNVTIAAGVPFNTANYRVVDVIVAPKFNSQDNYNVVACQVDCVQDYIIVTTPNIFTDGIRNSYKRDYIRFPGFKYPQAPGPFMLKGSSIDVLLVPPVATFVVILHFFTDTNECQSFFVEEDYKTTLSEVRYLNQSNGFRTNYTTTSDDFICIVTETKDGMAHVFNYSVNATTRQYRNLSYLMGQGLCLKNNTNLDPTNATVRLELSRWITHPRQTCVLVEVSSGLGKPATLDMTSTVYSTSWDFRVFGLSGAAGAVSMFLVGGLVIFACIYVYSRCHRSGLQLNVV